MPPFRNNGPGSPPLSAHRALPTGFLPSSRRPPNLAQLSRRELLDIYSRNQNVLNEPAPSTSTYHHRVVTEQAEIESILGMDTIEAALRNTHITEDESMGIEPSTSPSRTVDAKRRAISRYHHFCQNTSQKGTTKALGLDEAMELERQATLADMERKKQEEENRRKRGLPIRGEVLTSEEREARLWAFMNAKATESDEEDEDWNASSDEDDDPANWFEYEESQGHPLVDPDDLLDIIRIDEDRFS